MNKFLLPLVFASVLTLQSCVNEADHPDNSENSGSYMEIVNEDYYYKGAVRVKLTRKVADNFNVTITRSGEVITDYPELNTLLAEMGATKIKPMVPYSPKFAEREREWGLDLWYDIYFDESVSLTRATRSFAEIDIFQEIEAFPKIERIGNSVFAPVLEPNPIDQYTTRSLGGFNDPMLSTQWHYSNNGTIAGSIMGADINLDNAWMLTTGDPRVIVAVIDSGVDYTHEDLIDNLWVNEAELNGLPGVDDDRNGNGNGFIDDIHGYNFVTSSGGVIQKGTHGTHVAGTVAAVNNNGKGVAGVAGGNGSGNGVRIMICQTLDEDQDLRADVAEAFTYAADNGAIIAQNSWGYSHPGATLPGSVKVAIDYFIANAKCEGLMTGGVVIFAAGNDRRSNPPTYPAAYEPVVSVAAIDFAYKAATYTNYGTWVDITAPGGDEIPEVGGVMSTYPNNTYAYAFGTSMACPHVSGIAALAISHFGSDTFTADELKALLTGSSRDIIYSFNTDKAGQMGTGLIDASKVLGVTDFLPPFPIHTFSASWQENTVGIYWKAVLDGRRDVVEKYEVIVKKSAITQSDFENLPEGAIKETYDLSGDNLSIDQPIYKTIQGLTANTTYYLGVVAVDKDGKRSDLKMIQGKTKGEDDDDDDDDDTPKNNTVAVYPTVVKDGILNIGLGTGVSGNIKISIFNTGGARVFGKNVDNAAAESIITCEIGKLSSGNYYVLVGTPQGDFQRTIVKL